MSGELTTPPSTRDSGLRARNLVTRVDGKMVNVARKTGQLFVCVNGCCCGHTDRGFAPVPADLYHSEWERRRLRNKVHLSQGGCLGPCPLANVVMLLFDGRSLWFHSFNSEGPVLALYDYIEQMLAAQSYLPPPPSLAEYHFTAFNWEPRPGESHLGADRRTASQSAESGGFLFLTQADTDLLALSRVVPSLPPDFPPVKAHNVSHLKSDDDIAAFLGAALPVAEIVILRLLGGRGSFRGGFERVVEHVQANGKWLVCLPGTDTLDPELTAVSNVGVPVTHEAFAYLQMGGLKNYEHALRFLSDHLLTTGFGYDPPEPQPRHGLYHPDVPEGTLEAWRKRADPHRPTLGVLFYRSHLLSGNTAFVDALVREGEARGANVLPVFTYSLKDWEDGEGQNAQGTLPSALRYFLPEDGNFSIDLLIATTSFAAGTTLSPSHPPEFGEGLGSEPDANPFATLGVPVLQAITATSGSAQWAASQRGLSPIDTAINVAIPELDGRIIGVPVSFKEQQPLAPLVRSAGDRQVLEDHDALPSALLVRSAGACPPHEIPESEALENVCNCSTPVQLGSPVLQYVPQPDRVARLIGQALRLMALRRKPNHAKRIAFVLTNYNARASRIANAVGLDSPASLMRVLEAMREAGYRVGNLPQDGDALLHQLIERGSYDLELVTEAQLAGAIATVPEGRYRGWFAELPEKNQAEMARQWGEPPGDHYVDGRRNLGLGGLELGNVFVAIQPPRGYGMDPAAIYHQPDLPPPHPYHALYRWLAEAPEYGGWGADAIVHLGKHGTLEWLPGKGVGVSAECYPDLFLADLPLVYPFIINNPGEGAQAKRRTHAVIVDHLTPPMTTADGYGEIEQLARLVDEYYQLEQLDPSKLPLLQQQIWELIKQARLDADLGRMINWSASGGQDHTHEWDPQFHEDGVPYTLSDMRGRDFAHLVENLNGYLCELTSAQIRDGLHVLGQAPEGDQLIDTLLSLVRLPNLDVPSLRAGIAQCYGLDLDVVLADLGRRFPAPPKALVTAAGRPLPTHADALEAIDELGKRLVVAYLEPDAATSQAGQRIKGQRRAKPSDGILRATVPHVILGPHVILSGAKNPPRGTDASLKLRMTGTIQSILTATPDPPRAFDSGELMACVLPNPSPDGVESVVKTLRFLCQQVLPNLQRTTDEIANLLRALDGRYIPPGPSGAPTRGMAHVLPTGRNFYTVDPRALPSLAAWRVGQRLADELLERHQADEGRYPETVGIVIWGTSAMRTHGDDIAQVLALLGVRPRWQAESRRIDGFEVVSLEELGRPRIDVVCRISGFFRDAFPHLIALLDEAVWAVAALEEPPERNYVRKHQRAAHEQLLAAGLSQEQAAEKAGYRIFGCKPGTYGAGILPLIDERNWQGVADFAEAYVNWGGYAYTAEGYGVDARDEFRRALSGVQVAVKNQDNREHDIFDSDDYLQYHGGMIATIRALTGRNPRRYFGDSADPQRVKVRDLKEEALRVFRTRVVNPKWINSIRRHGYKGALELAATVDYLFGYDATSDVVDDWMYERLSEAYVLDAGMQEFFHESNPWALRDMAERLLEAMERGLWEKPADEMREALRRAYLGAEGVVEAGVGGERLEVGK